MITKEDQETLNIDEKTDIEERGKYKKQKSVKGEKVQKIMELADSLEMIRTKDIKDAMDCSDTALSRYRKGQKADPERIQKLIEFLSKVLSGEHIDEPVIRKQPETPIVKSGLSSEPTEKLVAELTRRGFSVTLQFKDKE